MKARDIWILFPALCGMVAYIFWMHRDEPWGSMRIAGACMAVFGLLMWSVARFQLGAAFSVKAKASVLVTRGIYSRIRNPIYVFGGIMIAGMMLFFLKPEYLLIFAVLVPMQIIRARRESAVLEAAFGDEYRRYKARTWFWALLDLEHGYRHCGFARFAGQYFPGVDVFTSRARLEVLYYQQVEFG
jgi:protein-S-isoprenylcysteine O-methyltransferase Ste14